MDLANVITPKSSSPSVRIRKGVVMSGKTRPNPRRDARETKFFKKRLNSMGDLLKEAILLHFTS
jgi:hypothetical protein